MKHFKNLELTAGAILASLAGSSLASANHSTTAHATTVVSNESSKTDTKQNDGSKTLNIITAKAEADAKSKNGEGTSPLKATADSDVPLSPSDAKAQINNVNKSDEKKNFDQAVDEAKKTDGIQVIQDTNVKHQASKTSENDVKKDYQDQADTIKKQVEDQKQKLADYNTKKQTYDKNRQDFINSLKKQGLWKEGTTDPSTLAQNLVLSPKKDAKVTAEILGTNGNIEKNNTIYRNTSRTDINGDYLRLTYTDLKNSSYNGKKIGKLVLTFENAKYSPYSWGTLSDVWATSGNPNDLDAGIIFDNNPMNGFTYKHISSTDVKITAYDENGNLINFTDEAPAYLTVASLNSYDDGHEYAKLISKGSAIKIPESSVNVHDGNMLYADKNNGDFTKSNWSKEIADKYSGWDNNTSPNYIFGAGLFKVTGSEIKLNIGNTATGSAWFLYNTNIPQMSFDAEGPQKPSTTIHYHDNEIQIPASITVKYVDQDTGKEIPDTQFKQNGNEGDSITYTTADTISKLQLQGYTLVSDDFTGKAGNKLSEDNNGKTYVVTLKKQSQDKPSTPETKDGTQTIHIIDKKTGNVLTTVVKGGKIGENIPVSLKVPKGYHLIQGQKLPTSVNIKDKDNAINVYVEKDEAKPAVTTPSNNNNSMATPAPVENTKAPATIANASVKAQSAPVANNTPAPAQQATLPQTGNSSSTAGIVAGSTLLATMATLGIAYKKRKN